MSDTSGSTAGGETENPTTSSGVETDADSGTGAETSSSGTGETTASVCGDGVVGAEEACDDAVNDGGYGGCMPDCSALAPRCGDGEVSGPEDCDDADEVDGNGCNNDCVVSGAELWTVEGAPAGLCGGFSGGIAVDSEDEILVAQTSACDGELLIAWLAKYDAGGGPAWSQSWGTNDSGSFGVDTRGTDSVVVGFDAGQASWRTYDSGGELLDGGFSESSLFFGVASDDEGFIAAGTDTTEADFLLQSFAWDGALSWSAPGEGRSGDGWTWLRTLRGAESRLSVGGTTAGTTIF